ncbi:siderophore-interacting protein [Microbacterium indicum]|uniref:siderophore-interacting protein n=1 Tax=Microbacterium indicum TaxID=358100 RepID=UPI0004004F3D|nr:siderophore-interacting protein [Microbacterium indicum]
MAEELASGRAVKPANAHVTRLTVVAAERISAGFQRVTLATDDERFAGEFDAMGHDQWFRLFLPREGEELVLPESGLTGWYATLLAMPDDDRPTVRNYTIRDARRDGSRWLLDVDFVVHTGRSGEVEGEAAAWALRARAGDQVGVLDQGRIFHAPDDAERLVIVADESGVPGVEGILRSLGEGVSADVVLEVPHGDDRRSLPTPADARVRWHVRGPGERAGDGALALLADVTVDDGAYAYLVGEAGFMLEGRRMLLDGGMSKGAMDFCAYWRGAKRRSVAESAR